VPRYQPHQCVAACEVEGLAGDGRETTEQEQRHGQRNRDSGSHASFLDKSLDRPEQQ
jgi:hypothetical protein